MLRAIDECRRKQADLPSRPEVVRRVMAERLALRLTSAITVGSPEQVPDSVFFGITALCRPIDGTGASQYKTCLPSLVRISLRVRTWERGPPLDDRSTNPCVGSDGHSRRFGAAAARRMAGKACRHPFLGKRDRRARVSCQIVGLFRASPALDSQYSRPREGSIRGDLRCCSDRASPPAIRIPS